MRQLTTLCFIRGKASILMQFLFLSLFLLEKSPALPSKAWAAAINEASVSSLKEDEDAKQSVALRPQQPRPQPRQTNRTSNEADASMVPIHCKETTKKGWFYF